MAVYRNHKKSFLGPGPNLAALGLITGFQPGCQRESHMIRKGGLSVEIHC